MDCIWSKDLRMNVEIYTDWSIISGFKEEWRTLLKNSVSDNLFLTWEWVTSWRDSFGHQFNPFLITVRNSNKQLVGLAPLYTMDYKLFRVVKFRILRVMGDYDVGAEYPNFIVDKDHEESALSSIFVALSNVKDRWDCIWMPSMWCREAWITKIQEFVMKNDWQLHRRGRAFSAFELPQSADEYMNGFSSKKRNSIKRLKQKIFENNASFQKADSLEEVKMYLEDLFLLHHKRWKTKGEQGSFVKHKYLKQFYNDFVPKAFDNDWLRFYKMDVGGKCKAIQIGYVYDKSYYQIQEGFDPDFLPGVGNVLRFLAIEDLIGENVHVYDFLGGISEHKRRWKAKERQGCDLLIGNSSFKNKLLFLVKIWPTGRFLTPSIDF